MIVILTSFVTDRSAAFILYRQHHQAAVVAANPGLANPEISKIIGDHWRSSTPEIKNHWRILAEVCSEPVELVLHILTET